MREVIPAADLLSHRSLLAPYIEKAGCIKDIITGLTNEIYKIGASLPEEEYRHVADGVWIHKDSAVDPGVKIEEATIIGGGCNISPCCWLHGGVVIGHHVTLGLGCDIKGSILYDLSCVGSSSSLEYSLLGYRAHIGQLCLLRSDLPEGVGTELVKSKDGVLRPLPTSVKVGSVVGDCARIAPQCILESGCHVGAFAAVASFSDVRQNVASYATLHNYGYRVCFAESAGSHLSSELMSGVKKSE